MFSSILKYRRDIAFLVLIGFIFYWVMAVFTPKIEKIDLYQTKIDSIDNNISNLKNLQSDIDNNIYELKSEVVEVEETISTVKNQKIIVKEYYEDKINSVDKFTDAELDSFFTVRYGRQYTF